MFAADVDGDEDMDVLSASYGGQREGGAWYNDKVAWYENRDGQGTFSEQKVLGEDVGGASAVTAADLDGDGDLDLCFADEIANSMSILINKQTRVICQGITGNQGQFHTEQCIAYGTQVVGGVDIVPGRQELDREAEPPAALPGLGQRPSLLFEHLGDAALDRVEEPASVAGEPRAGLREPERPLAARAGQDGEVLRIERHIGPAGLENAQHSNNHL